MSTDLMGRRFSRWLVIGRAESADRRRRPRWSCRCDCGVVRDVCAETLTRGVSRSCGCLQRDTVSKHGHAKHGEKRSLMFGIWVGMIQRCDNPNAAGYATYGARGVSVCPRWRSSFAAFLEDMGPRPSPKHSIDRIDNDGIYEPANCRWATREQQSCNMSTNRHIVFDGKRLTIAEWARETGMPRATIDYRIRSGWSAAEALTSPANKGRPDLRRKDAQKCLSCPE